MDTLVSLDQLCINTIRFLAVDAVEKANSGHPGLPLGASPMAFTLWDRYLKFNPKDPHWFNRDRFVLSAGHGCAMLYALLHLYGFGLSIDDLKRFRQWGSKTPGHPEFGHTPGVEATTGPLGQGVGMSVGMAIAERYLASLFNAPGFEIVDHRVFALVSDGDLMEGVSSEAASLAGHLKLNKLTFLYDDNHITIDGNTDITFTEDVQKRFEAYGWNVLRVADGNDVEAIAKALDQAIGQEEQPSLIICRTHIGYGSPKQDSAKVHGSPLGADAMRATKETLGWPLEPTFYVPDEVKPHFGRAIQRGADWQDAWTRALSRYDTEHPAKGEEFKRFLAGRLPEKWGDSIPRFSSSDGAIATRDASQKIMNAIAAVIPTFIGGSADLAESNKTELISMGNVEPPTYSGRNIHFGIREHAMGASVNGLALNGLVPFGSTFLIFSDYMKPSIRLSALMQCHSIWVFTHDSIFVGEDGPTHEPIEQTMALRAIPGLDVFRPADANESAEAWRFAIQSKLPTALLFTRQKLPILDIDRYPVLDGVSKGAYVLAEPLSSPCDLVLIATGSEVHLALAAQIALMDLGIRTRVVSMPCWELFERQTEAYKESVLPTDTLRLSVEAGTTLGWQRWADACIGIDRFGASAPGEIVYDELGFNVADVVAKAQGLLTQKQST